jgi:hypothetical protein
VRKAAVIAAGNRAGFLSDGAKVTWEYPRQARDGDQMDIVEVMDIHDGLIRHHRVYWGWYSVRMITAGDHPKLARTTSVRVSTE